MSKRRITLHSLYELGVVFLALITINIIYVFQSDSAEVATHLTHVAHKSQRMCFWTGHLSKQARVAQGFLSTWMLLLLYKCNKKNYIFTKS